MATALDAAKVLIEIGTVQAEDEQGDAMTNMRVNKLLYFAQGYCLAKYGKPLFTDRIEAWKKGPVVPSVYDHYKPFGWNIIVDTPAERSKFTSEEFNLLIDISEAYRFHSTTALSDKTHEDGSPWKQCYIENERVVIQPELIRKYFLEHPLEETASERFTRNIKSLAIQPKFNEQGIPVLPKEWAYD